jgi:hypothetical protein
VNAAFFFVRVRNDRSFPAIPKLAQLLARHRVRGPISPNSRSSVPGQLGQIHVHLSAGNEIADTYDYIGNAAGECGPQAFQSAPNATGLSARA